MSRRIGPNLFGSIGLSLGYNLLQLSSVHLPFANHAHQWRDFFFVRPVVFRVAAKKIQILGVNLIAGVSNSNNLEKVGIHKRDILVDRVEAARDAQSEASEQFKSALEQFSAVVRIENTDLKNAYEKLNTEYEDSEASNQFISEIKQ